MSKKIEELLGTSYFEPKEAEAKLKSLKRGMFACQTDPWFQIHSDNGCGGRKTRQV